MFLSHERKVKCLHILVTAHKPTGTITSGNQDAAFPQRARLYSHLATHEHGTSCTNNMGFLQTPWSSPLSFLSLPSLCHSPDASDMPMTPLGFHSSCHLRWHPSQIKPIQDSYHRLMVLLFSVVCSSELWHSGNPNVDGITSASDAFPHFPCRLPPSLSVQPETERGAVLRPTQT